MSQIQEAADNIKAFASRVRGFLDVADALEKIGKIDQAEREAKKSAEAAVRAATVAESDLNSKLEKVAKADDDINYAKKSAEEIIANANKRARTIMDEAGVGAQALVREFDERKAKVQKEIAALNAKLSGVARLISEKESILGGIHSQIEAAKEKVASLFK